MRERSRMPPRAVLTVRTEDSAISSTHSSTAESIPSPSRSILRKPASAQESLSHWTELPPGHRGRHAPARARPAGGCEITIPPGCCEMCRGRPPISRAELARTRASAVSGASSRRPAATPPLRATRRGLPVRRAAREPLQLCMREAERLARRRGSRRARGRSGSVATSAACSRPYCSVTADDQLLADVARKVEVDVGHRRHARG